MTLFISFAREPEHEERGALRIAYVCYWNAYANDGVAQKIRTQISLWREAGHDVALYCLSPPPRSAGSERALGDRVFHFRSKLERFAATRKLMGAVVADAPDLVYLRFDWFIPTLAPLLRALPAVVEINAGLGGRMDWSWPRRAYHSRNLKQVLRGVNGVVCVSHEIARVPSSEPYRRPTIVIGNGIDLDGVEPLAPAKNARPVLVFVGSPGHAWHGTEKIVALAWALPDAELEIIGLTGEQLPGPLPPNLRAHGFLSRSDYVSILARSDVGIGSLALHRIGLEEASPLKVREYLAHGLPTVIAYGETDFPGDNPWFLLRLPNTEKNVQDNVEQIRKFVQRVRGRRVLRREIESAIGARGKEARRLEFMAEIAAQAPPRRRPRRRLPASDPLRADRLLRGLRGR